MNIMADNRSGFVLSTPEQEGISTDSVKRFLTRLENKHIPLHSFLLMRHGRLVSEVYYAPYDRNTMHRMFSITKSFTSIAIGCLVREGKISLDDKITDYFADKLPKSGAHPLLAMTTIRDMLRMASPYDKTTYKQFDMDDWVKTFFIAHPNHIPGTCFSYDTSASHTLAALVEKLTGMTMLDYLRSIFLDEIGFSKDAYAFKDPVGNTLGGSGLMCTPRDLLAVMSVVASGGVYDGKQLLPGEYLKEATSKQISTTAKAATYEESFGYGYQFWMTRHGGYACYGMGGQYAVYIPDKDIIYVTTADTQAVKDGTQEIYDAFWDEIYDNAGDGALEPLTDNRRKEYETFFAGRKLASVKNECTGDEVNKYTGGMKNISSQYAVDDNDIQFNGFDIEFRDDFGMLRLDIAGMDISLPFGMNYNIECGIPDDGKEYTAASSAGWTGRDTLLINAQIIDECVGNIIIQITFRHNDAVVMMLKHEENKFNEFSGFFCAHKA